MPIVGARRRAAAADLGGYRRCWSGRTTGAYTGPLLDSNDELLEALLQASPYNAGIIQVGAGASGNSPIEMAPGDWVTLPVARLNMIRVVIGADDYVNFFAFTN